jgi:hypothetical protein
LIVKQYSIGETLLGRIRFWTSSYNKIDEGEGSHLTLSVVYGSETAPSWYFSTSDKHNSQGENFPLWKKAFVQNAENEYIALYYRVVIRMIPVHVLMQYACIYNDLLLPNIACKADNKFEWYVISVQCFRWLSRNINKK